MKKFLLAAWIIALLCISGIQGWSNRNWYLDDSYIALQYGYHISAGNGWVYNPGERINGCTSPVNTLLAALACRISAGHADWVMHFFDEVFLAACCILIALIFWEHKRYAAAFIGPLFIICDNLMHMLYGMEPVLFLMMGLVCLQLYLKKNPWLGIGLGLLMLSRPDGFVLAVVILFFKMVRDKRVPFLDIALASALVLPWLIFALGYFHDILPTTLSAKIAQKQSGLWRSKAFALALVPFWRERYHTLLPSLILLPFLLAGVWESIRRFQAGLILVLWASLHTLAYTLMKVEVYYWYFAPVFLVADVIIALGADQAWALVRGRARFKSKTQAAILAATSLVLILALLYPHWRLIRHSVRLKLPPRERAYVQVGKWLKQNTAPDKSVLATEIGAIGYYSERKIIDPCGLVVPKDIIEELRRSEFKTLLERYPPDYVLIHQEVWEMEILILRELPKKYQMVKYFQFPDYGNLYLYAKKAPDK